MGCRIGTRQCVEYVAHPKGLISVIPYSIPCFVLYTPVILTPGDHHRAKIGKVIEVESIEV